ncbi:hypothetical protein TNCV_3906221 [Trichonephila clavipes]|nr:hypothetical protein TNCV_3906221 [Trichonephila clavipes]
MVALYPVGIWLMASPESMGGPRAPTPQEWSTGCSVHRQSVRGYSSQSNTTQNFDIGCKTSVAMYNATFDQTLTVVSPNLNLTNVMLQAKAGFVSKHNNVPFRCPCPLFIVPLAAQTPVVSRVNEGIDALRTFYSATYGVKWYERLANLRAAARFQQSGADNCEQEKDIEELESLDPVQSEDRIKFGNLTEGLSLNDKGLQIFQNMDSNEECTLLPTVNATP